MNLSRRSFFLGLASIIPAGAVCHLIDRSKVYNIGRLILEGRKDIVYDEDGYIYFCPREPINFIQLNFVRPNHDFSEIVGSFNQ